MAKFLVRVVALCLMLAPVIGSAQTLNVGITLAKDVELDRWVINYEFSETIDAVKFDNTPYSFVENDWKIQTAGATLDFSLLQAKLGNPGKHLSIAFKSENDHFIKGFYTP